MKVNENCITLLKVTPLHPFSKEQGLALHQKTTNIQRVDHRPTGVGILLHMGLAGDELLMSLGNLNIYSL